MSSEKKYYIYSAMTNARLTKITGILLITSMMNFSIAKYGLLQSVFVFSQLIFEFPSGVLGDLIKKKTVIVSGLCLLLLSPMLILASYLFTNFSFFILVMAFAIEGMGSALLSGADDALFFEELRNEGKESKYTQIRGQMQFCCAIVGGLATFIGGAFFEIDYRIPYLIQSLLQLIAIIVILSLHETKSVITERKNGTKEALERLSVFKNLLDAPQILFMFFFTTIIVSSVNAIFSFLPDYISEMGYSSSQNGLIFMIFSLVGGLIATQVYRLNDLSLHKLILLILSAICIGTIFQIQGNKVLFLLGMMLMYVVIDILDPIIMKMINLWVTDSSRATIISGLSFAISLMTMIVNIILGMVIEKCGMLISVFSVSAIIIILTAVTYLKMIKKRN